MTAQAVAADPGPAAPSLAAGPDHQNIGGAPIAPRLGLQVLPTSVSLHQIDIPSDRLREVDPQWAEAIATSIRQVGLLTPIEVYRNAAAPIPRYTLVHGAHRLEALRAVGETAAMVLLVPPLTVEERREREAIENLLRNDLTALERGESLSLLKELHDARHPAARRGGDRRSARARDQDQSASIAFCSDATSKTDLGRRTIETAIAMWRSLDAGVANRLRRTPIANNLAALRQIAALHVGLQVRVVDLLLVEPAEAGTVADAVLLAEGKRLDTVQEKRFRAVTGSLARLPAEQRGVLFDLHADEIIARFRQKGLL